tara:strand:- start:722 stop:985 length:264 start_codon:yes stop_codon:yes gene_type:complete
MYYANKYYADDLKIGMAFKDVVSGDVGILVKRYNVLEDWEDTGPIWAWDILWTGPCTNTGNTNQPYTEMGILGMINAGRLELCDDKE